MPMQLNASNASSFGELANFCWIRIDENADGASSCWERVHNSADHSRLDVARARWIKVEPNHVRAEFDARARIIRSCNTADFDLYPVGAIGCSHGAVRCWESGRTGHRRVTTTHSQRRPIFCTSDESAQRNVVKSCYAQQHSICADGSCFVDLNFVNDKVLAQNRKGRIRANRAEIENRTTKVLFVRQDRDGTRATALVTSGNVARGQITTD